MTDVNIATELLCDAEDDAFHTAIVISGDGDLAGPIQAVRQRNHKRPVVVAFPPDRHSAALKKVATGYFTIGRDLLRDSQLPESEAKPNGYVLTRPASWQ